jgi:two-component system sensor histidine kinase HydH
VILLPKTGCPFNLRLWFAIGSCVTIALICAVSAYLVSNFLTKSLLERESAVAEEFLESIVTIDGGSMFHDDGSEPWVPSPILLDFAKHIVSMPGMLRINIYAPTHRVLWSTEKQIVGKYFNDNDELDEAYRGERVTEIGSLPDPSKQEHEFLGQTGHFIEAYIPVRADGGRGPILGVVEFYKLTAALESTIESGQRAVWSVAALAAVTLFVVLYWIVQRGGLLIERQQRHMAQMEAFAAIGQMSSAVAHSLRNPMSAIRSSAELWKTQELGPDRGVTDEVIREVDRMDSYVRDLLSYARSEPYHLQPVDPMRVVGKVLTKLQKALDRQDIEVRADDRRGAAKSVMADEMLLEQALTSVLTNAIEAMPDGGLLTVWIGPNGRSGFTRIKIIDNGRGIPPELMKRVAQAYFTTKSRGLGLGLMLAKGVIDRFQGVFEIASAPDRGTAVCIDLKSA